MSLDTGCFSKLGKTQGTPDYIEVDPIMPP